MKYTDYTQPGGFPLTQDRLNDLQVAYTEAILALAGVGGDITGPMVINGMAVSVPAPGDVAVANGWLVYNGDLIKFTGSTVTPGVGEVALVLISTSETPLTFYDGSAPLVRKDKTATLMVAATATDATHFPLTDLKPFGRERDWTNIPVAGVSDGVVTGYIDYKKNSLANAVLLRGALEAINATDFAAMGAEEYYEMGTLPDGYKPLTEVYFICSVTTLNVNHPSSTELIKFLNGKVATDGKIYVEWMQFLGFGGGLDFGTYDVEFTTMLFLD